MSNENKKTLEVSKEKARRFVGTPYVAVFGKTLENGYIEVENNLTGEKTEMSFENFATSFISLENNRTTNIENIVKKSTTEEITASNGFKKII